MNQEIKRMVRIAKKSPEMWQDIVLSTSDNVVIAQKYAVTPGYVSQLKSLVTKMRNPPKIVNGKVVCCFCDKDDPLVVHHDHATGEIIGLICRSCNRKPENQLLGINDKSPLEETTSTERSKAFATRMREDREDLKQLYGLLAKYAKYFKNDLNEEERAFLKELDVTMKEKRFK